MVVGFFCLFSKLIWRFKKPEERVTLHQIMQVLLPVLYERCASLMANDTQPAEDIEVQKQILKVYFALIQVSRQMLQFGYIVCQLDTWLCTVTIIDNDEDNTV